jgi:hypothetical protein
MRHFCIKRERFLQEHSWLLLFLILVLVFPVCGVTYILGRSILLPASLPSLSEGELQRSQALNKHLAQTFNPSSSYVGAITAEESLVLAVASDLRTYLHHKGLASTQLLNEMHTAAYKLYSVGAKPTTNGGWLLQPGKWKNHPDYLYAGHESVPTLTICADPDSEDPSCNLEPRPVDGIGMDVSHFLSKWPVCLTAYRDASYDNPTRHEFFERLLAGIEVQIFNQVIKPQPAKPPYLLTNYMDGTNGVYRWNYERRGKNWGYNASHLSSTPCFSSLALLNSDRIREFYQQIDQTLPYTMSEVAMMGSNDCNSNESRLLISLSRKLSNSAQNGTMLISNAEAQLFQETFATTLLSKDSWVGIHAYEGVVGARQVVLHAAFSARKKEWIDTFSNHFSLFITDVQQHGWLGTSDFYKWHQLLFTSRYLLLSAQLNIDSDLHDQLFGYLYKEIADAWEGQNDPPVSNVGWGEPAFNNYRDWIEWKTELAQ